MKLLTIFLLLVYYSYQSCDPNQIDLSYYVIGSTGCLDCTANCVYCLPISESEAQCGYCEWGYYLMDDGTCSACIDHCDDCNGPTLDECYLPSYGYWYNPDTNKLESISVDHCQEANYLGECQQCLEGYVGVSSSTDDTIYTSCDSISIENCLYAELDKNQEQLCWSCDNGYYVNSAGDQCVPGTIENCLYYYDGKCSSCEDGYSTSTNGKTCISCAQYDDNCSYCDESNCYYCDSGYSLDENGECQPCSEHCSYCYNGMCSSCDAGYYGVQKDNTNTELYVYDVECQQCTIDHCAWCYESFDNNGDSIMACSQCELGYELNDSGECAEQQTETISHCLLEYYGYCQQCEYGYFSSYDDQYNSVCKKCHSSCGRCYGELSTECSQCPVNQYLNYEYDLIIYSDGNSDVAVTGGASGDTASTFKMAGDMYYYGASNQTCVDSCPKTDANGNDVSIIDNYGQAYCSNDPDRNSVIYFSEELAYDADTSSAAKSSSATGGEGGSLLASNQDESEMRGSRYSGSSIYNLLMPIIMIGLNALIFQFKQFEKNFCWWSKIELFQRNY